jgi:hypothetical protein
MVLVIERPALES